VGARAWVLACGIWRCGPELHDKCLGSLQRHDGVQRGEVDRAGVEGEARKVCEAAGQALSLSLSLSLLAPVARGGNDGRIAVGGCRAKQPGAVGLGLGGAAADQEAKVVEVEVHGRARGGGGGQAAAARAAICGRGSLGRGGLTTALVLVLVDEEGEPEGAVPQEIVLEVVWAAFPGCGDVAA